MNNAFEAAATLHREIYSPAMAREFIESNGIIAALPRHEDVVVLHKMPGLCSAESKVTIHRMKRAGTFEITVELGRAA